MELIFWNTTFPLNWYQLNYHIMETTLSSCKDFTQCEAVSRKDSVLGAFHSEAL